jgi:hypothetical protein
VKHPSNQQLFAYWTERRGARAAPDRDDIDPAAIRAFLGDSFILARDDGDDFAFRVAGTRLCALFGRELRDLPFAGIWDAAGADDIRAHCAVVAGECVAIAGGARAQTDTDLLCNFEVLLLPLFHRGQPGTRLLGLIAPLERPFWLGIWPAQALRLGAIQYIGTTAAAPPRDPAGLLRARARRSLTVVDGGR